MTAIAVVGAGVGGLVAALALRQAGYDPIIYERAHQFGEVGAGISLSPNSVKGLESLGLQEFLARVANEPLDQRVFHGVTGEELLCLDRRHCREKYGAPYYQLHRADLMAALVDRFGRSFCRMGKALKGVNQDERGCIIGFEDGSFSRADVVIGADGLRSVIRETVFEPSKPQFSGHVAWRALVPSSKLAPRALAPTNINHVGNGRNFVTYPVRGQQLVNIVAMSRAAAWAEESWSSQAASSELAAVFEGWVDYVAEAIAAVDDAALFRWGLFVRDPLKTWVSGRIALLGDAAHPMLPYLGQGASSAIEDGIVLGRCFSASSGDPVLALHLYEATRLPRASFLQAESNLGGDRLQLLDPYVLRDTPPQDEDSLGIFKYDPTAVSLESA